MSKERDIRDLHPLCREKLHKLEQKGLPVSPYLDYADIIELNHLCWEVTHPTENKRYKQDLLKSSDIQVSDDLTFYPWTIGSSVWIQDVATPLFKDDEYNLSLCISFALAHSNDKDVFRNLQKKEDIKKTVRKWARGLNVTHEEMAIVWEKLLPNSNTFEVEDIKDQKTERSDFFPIVTRLMSEFGNTHDYWVWEIAGEIAFGHIDEWNYWKQLEHKAEIQAAGKNASNPESPESIALVNVVRKLGKMIERLEVRKREANKANNG